MASSLTTTPPRPLRRLKYVRITPGSKWCSGQTTCHQPSQRTGFDSRQENPTFTCGKRPGILLCCSKEAPKGGSWKKEGELSKPNRVLCTQNLHLDSNVPDNGTLQGANGLVSPYPTRLLHSRGATGCAPYFPGFTLTHAKDFFYWASSKFLQLTVGSSRHRRGLDLRQVQHQVPTSRFAARNRKTKSSRREFLAIHDERYRGRLQAALLDWVPLLTIWRPCSSRKDAQFSNLSYRTLPHPPKVPEFLSPTKAGIWRRLCVPASFLYVSPPPPDTTMGGSYPLSRRVVAKRERGGGGGGEESLGMYGPLCKYFTRFAPRRRAASRVRRGRLGQHTT
ncbi:hypothetical protein PR048_022919 [Dryococelus australis]|uniref:Uncharacterized protein n=1 Tax=Dryococelus australis TaxID=614101 RepID=A0ABQ9GSM3_9NEOP|nr:hypothetical protein PR048_022919 [Dryococelus australis]